jgi:hypothetical protein
MTNPIIKKITNRLTNKIALVVISVLNISLITFSTFLPLKSFAKKETVDNVADAKIGNIEYGVGFFNIFLETFLNILRTGVNVIFIPICIAIIILKLVIIILGFLGGGQGNEMAQHIKHIFLTLLILGILIAFGQGNNIVKFFLENFATPKPGPTP